MQLFTIIVYRLFTVSLTAINLIKDNIMKAPVNSGNIDLHTEGPVTACIRAIIDLGIQPAFNASSKPAHKIVLFFETNEQRSDGKNFTLPVYFTLCLGDLCTLRRDLGLMRGKPLTDEECDVFDFTKLINFYTAITVAHKNNAKGEARAYIYSFNGLPDPSTKFTPSTPELFFDLTQYTEQQAAAVPEYFYNKINFDTYPNSRPTPGHPANPNAANSFDEMNEDGIPGWG